MKILNRIFNLGNLLSLEEIRDTIEYATYDNNLRFFASGPSVTVNVKHGWGGDRC